MRFSVEQIVGMLKQAQVGVPVAEVIRKVGISEQTYYHWKAKRLKELEQENGKLKRLVAELSLDKQILQDIARGNF